MEWALVPRFKEQCIRMSSTVDEIAIRTRDLPSNHSPRYAPVIEPTLSTGIAALTAAARIWLQP